MEECFSAFQKLKKYLSQPPVMSKLKNEEVLIAYIATAPHAVSLILIQVDDRVQRPVYYVSKSLHEAEIRYLPLEKVILAVVTLHESSLITSKLAPLWSSPSFPFNHYFEGLTTRGRLQNREQS